VTVKNSSSTLEGFFLLGSADLLALVSFLKMFY